MQTVSAELNSGVSMDGISLGAKLSTMLSTTVQTLAQQQVTHEYSYQAPVSQMVVVTLWQLWYDLTYTDAQGVPASYQGLFGLPAWQSRPTSLPGPRSVATENMNFSMIPVPS